MNLVKTQDDYAMVLSFATFAEDTLGRLLIAYLRDCTATTDLIDGFNAPLGTFSARIKASYSIGLVTKQQFDDLEILRRVRNKFAHNWEEMSLEKGEIKAMLGKLSGYTFDVEPVESVGRERLINSMISCCAELQIFLSKIEDKSLPKIPDVSFRLTTVAPGKLQGTSNP